LLKQTENKNLKYGNTIVVTVVDVKEHICANLGSAGFVFVNYLSRAKYLGSQKQAGSGGGIENYVNV
jgi:hypothetical protein